MKWKRVKPGLYELVGPEGVEATVERGAETGRWWWKAWGGSKEAGLRKRLVDAKCVAERAAK